MGTQAHTSPLADPVCGRAVTLDAAHRQVHGGALFVFCSEHCRATFAAHPRRWAFITLSGGVRPPVPPPATGLAPDAPDPSARSLPPATGLLSRWREKRFALACCREMLQLHDAIARHRPDLRGEALYRHVLAQRLGSDGPAVEKMIQGATESYASWPVERALTFRDIVRFVAVSEFIGLHRDTPWVHDGLKHLVDDAVPSRL